MECYKCEKEILGDFYAKYYDTFHTECVENKEEAIYIKNQNMYTIFNSVRCDACDSEIHTYFYTNFDLSMDICISCFGNNRLLPAKFIDRSNLSVEEKPLNWQCFICSKLLGGGCKWYYLENSNKDICTDCYNPETIYKFVKDNFRFFDEEKSDQYLILDRTEFSFVLNTKPKTESLVDTNELLKEYIELSAITHLDIRQFADDILEDLCNAEITSSIKDWVIFTNTEHCLLDFGSQLVVNNNKDSEEFSQIGILICDNHGRYQLRILYKTISDFIIDYKEFAKNVKSKEDCEKGLALSEEKLYKEYSINIEDILPFIDKFGNYMVIKNRLKYYFG